MEMSRDERRKKACSDFLATMTIEWEYLGRTKWTTKHGPEGFEYWVEHDKSRFRYIVTWGAVRPSLSSSSTSEETWSGMMWSRSKMKTR